MVTTKDFEIFLTFRKIKPEMKSDCLDVVKILSQGGIDWRSITIKQLFGHLGFISTKFMTDVEFSESAPERPFQPLIFSNSTNRGQYFSSISHYNIPLSQLSTSPDKSYIFIELCRIYADLEKNWHNRSSGDALPIQRILCFLEFEICLCLKTGDGMRKGISMPVSASASFEKSGFLEDIEDFEILPKNEPNTAPRSGLSSLLK